jgi:Enoyl-CoA hydratase/isomerase
VTIVTLADDDLEALVRSPHSAAELSTAHGVAAVVLDGQIDNPDIGCVISSLATVTIARCGGPLGQFCDTIADDADRLAELTAGINANPLASFALVSLLRGIGQLSIADGLAAESATYSMLQGGPEFAQWRAANPAKHHPHDGRPRLRVERDGSALQLTLDRPQRHNAFDTALRDELFDALLLAAADPSLTSIVLSGAGRSFCSGGDLDTFGTSPDPATAHSVRLARSCGRLLAELSNRVEVRLHGACFGAGIELPAFCGRVFAATDSALALPEVGLGLIPGAGGTVSLTRRIGRQRTAYLALSGARLDSATALAWGLVDGVA